MINKTLAILAGGKSSRMNYSNKAFLKYNEKSFIERIIEAGKDFQEIIIVSNNKEVYSEFSLKVVEDAYKEQGPLGGIHSALVNCRTDYCLCVACDMPFVSREVLNKLAGEEEKYEVVVPKVNNRLQPLCAIYSKSILRVVEESLERKENKLQKLIMSLDYKIIGGFSDKEFSNINTVEEYKVLREGHLCTE